MPSTISKTEKAKQAFAELIKSHNLEGNDLSDFIGFINDTYLEETPNQIVDPICEKDGEKALVLDTIIKSLKKDLPITAEASDEKILYPGESNEYSGKEFADYTSLSCFHVDAFLYDTKDVEELQDSGKLPTHYCSNCQSRDVVPLNYISHSASPDQLHHLFHVLLRGYIWSRHEQGVSTSIVDIGSRLGAILYAGHVFTPNSVSLTGIEISKQMTDICSKYLKRHKMENRCKVIHDDFRHQVEVLESANVIILNNVFQFFNDLPTQKDCWETLHKHTKPGQILVVLPDIKTQLEEAECLELKKKVAADHQVVKNGVQVWLKEVTEQWLEQSGFSYEDEEDEELIELLETIHIYVVA